MKIHHLNCATFCPPLVGKRLNDEGFMVCHCLLVVASGGVAAIGGTGSPPAGAGLGRGRQQKSRRLAGSLSIARGG